MESFYAHGKLLITGEYLVLKGVQALALPLNKGQTLTVAPSKWQGLMWRAETTNGVWFKAKFDNQLNIVETCDKKKAKKLQLLLHKAVEQNPDAKEKMNSHSVITRLEFDQNWGWGSSSTLLHLLAQWLKVDPYQIMDKTIGGSGYDIACAGANTPILYRRMKENSPEIIPVHFRPPFIEKMGIVYLNKKQNSSSQVKSFLQKQLTQKKWIDEISSLSHKFISEQSISSFMQLMHRHGVIIANTIDQIPVQTLLFPDYEGAVKSLGAWGGDFALFLSEKNFHINKKWFEAKGYSTVMPLNRVMVNN